MRERVRAGHAGRQIHLHVCAKCTETFGLKISTSVTVRHRETNETSHFQTNVVCSRILFLYYLSTHSFSFLCVCSVILSPLMECVWRNMGMKWSEDSGDIEMQVDRVWLHESHGDSTPG